MNNSPNPAPEPDTDRNEEGFIIVKEGEGVFYIRYYIIFAKAGDIFFMPRKVPKDFNADSDSVTISLKDNPGEFEKFFNTHFQPYKAHVSQVSERVPTKDEFEQFIDLSGSLK